MISLGISRALANVLIFLEFSSHDILDEDEAIQAIEQLGADLQALDAGSRKELAAGFASIASSYDGDVREFVASLPDALGIE